MEKKLTRSKTDRKIFGICGGIGKYFDIDPTVIRILWVIFSFMFGFGVLAYLVCALLIPEE